MGGKPGQLKGTVPRLLAHLANLTAGDTWLLGLALPEVLHLRLRLPVRADDLDVHGMYERLTV